MTNPLLIVPPVRRFGKKPGGRKPYAWQFDSARVVTNMEASLHVPTGTPPVFLAHGGDDIISSPEQSVFMYLALKRAGVPAELHIYATAAHDFGVRRSEHPCSTWTQACGNWLRQQQLLK